MKRHLNLRPYECQICKAKFARSSTLKVHNLTHFSKSEDKETIPSSQNEQDLPCSQSINEMVQPDNTMENNNYANLMSYFGNNGGNSCHQNYAINDNNMYNTMYNNYLINAYRDNLISMLYQRQLLSLLAGQSVNVGSNLPLAAFINTNQNN
jgi:hypothetical protein